MTLKKFFDLKMGLLLASMAILLTIMAQMSPPETLDVRLFYSNLEANFYLRSLSGEALKNYLFVECLDLFFIYKYTRTLTLALRRLRPTSPLWLMGLIPGFFDLVETGTIIAAIHSGHGVLAVPGLGYFTCLKWISALVVTVMTLFSLVSSARDASP